MGYYTDYNLSVSVDNPHTAALIEEEIRKMGVFDFVHCDREMSQSQIKWYDWADDMALLSSKFPDVLFELHGDGEDANDLWDAYFLGGKMQECKAEIVFPPYDKSKLETVALKDKYSYQKLEDR